MVEFGAEEVEDLYFVVETDGVIKVNGWEAEDVQAVDGERESAFFFFGGC